MFQKKVKTGAGPGRARGLSEDGEGEDVDVAHISSIHTCLT